MRTEYLVAVAAVASTVAGGLAVYSVSSQSDYCPQPSATSVTALFAPCQTFDTAMGHAVSKPEAVRMGLLAPEEQPASPVVTQLAARLAKSVDRFLLQHGG